MTDSKLPPQQTELDRLIAQAPRGSMLFTTPERPVHKHSDRYGSVRGLGLPWGNDYTRGDVDADEPQS